jgi:hypothetical protein
VVNELDVTVGRESDPELIFLDDMEGAGLRLAVCKPCGELEASRLHSGSGQEDRERIATTGGIAFRETEDLDTANPVILVGTEVATDARLLSESAGGSRRRAVLEGGVGTMSG